MPGKEIPDSAIELVAKHINTRSNKSYGIPVIGHEENIETPQIFEIIPFDQEDIIVAPWLRIGRSICWEIQVRWYGKILLK
ncbi:MAG: hypothetical protein V7L01_17925 [Nostoc sp.]|uniref:hypothetical protein n=1 Tax=Nostoc sp. TaxID=1180 RepID=UPI002FFD005E